MGASLQKAAAQTSTHVTQTSKQKGDLLEARVATLFRKQGKWNVQVNKRLVCPKGNHSQIDVTYGLWTPTYIECKNYTSRLVPLEDVAKFKEVLIQNEIPLKEGIFITTSKFSKRALETGICCIDGQGLEELEMKTQRFLYLKPLVMVMVFGSLHLLWQYREKVLPTSITTAPRLQLLLRTTNTPHSDTTTATDTAATATTPSSQASQASPTSQESPMDALPGMDVIEALGLREAFLWTLDRYTLLSDALDKWAGIHSEDDTSLLPPPPKRSPP